MTRQSVDIVTIWPLAGVGVSARHAIHVATMRRLGCTRILTFDCAFDAIPGVTRIA